MLICPTANHYFHLDHSSHYACLSAGTSISEKPGSYYSLLTFLIVHFQYTCIVVSESLTCNPMGNNFMSLGIMLRYRVFCLFIFTFSFIPFISKVTQVATSLNPFSKTVSYFCNTVRFFCHTLYFNQGSPDLLFI